MSKASGVAKLLGVSEFAAREFCFEVQGHMAGSPPAFKWVEVALRACPDASPEELAQYIATSCPVITSRSRPKPRSKSMPKPRDSQGQRKGTMLRLPLSRNPGLVEGVAAMLPEEDRGSEAAALIWLSDLEHIYIGPYCKHLTVEKLMTAIRCARRPDTLSKQRVLKEVRKLAYGYKWDPDSPRVISIATGGKSDR